MVWSSLCIYCGRNGENRKRKIHEILCGAILLGVAEIKEENCRGKFIKLP
jgi:hypothetical protein